MKVKWMPQEAQEISREGAIGGLVRASEYVLAKANETVPFQEAILKDSGDTDIDRAELVATVFYNTPYAARQHEDQSFKHPHGRRAKWLELTMQEQQDVVSGIFADAYKGKFG